jgi:ATP-dependent Lon protease
MIELDVLDRKADDAFPGSLVRKDLAEKFKGQYPIPTYVGEFLLGRYCASTDPDEIAEGLAIVERQLRDRTVRAGEHELFKSRARERGSVKLIDLITARLDAPTDSYLVTLPSLQLKDVRIADQLVRDNERMLTGGFYAEIDLEYQPGFDESSGKPFYVASLRPIQLSKRDILDDVGRARSSFATAEWRDLLLRSVGFEPNRFSSRAQDLLLLRMVPFVENNYNMVELGPRGTGKSHLFQQISPYAHLVSGGKATVARMFVDNRTGQRGLVAQYDVVCFDEVSGINFDSKDGVNIMKGYMESGEFSRGRESIRAMGGIVMVGNFEVDVAHQLREGHLLSPLPKEMRDDTAFMDRIHSYVPGWDVPKLDPTLFTNHFGLVSDFLAEVWTRLRDQSRLSAIQGRVSYGDALSGRDISAVNRTLSGLLKLLFPAPDSAISDADLEWAVRLAFESRLRVKEQQKRIGRDEFGRTDFSFELNGTTVAVATPEGPRGPRDDESRAPRIVVSSAPQATGQGRDGPAVGGDRFPVLTEGDVRELIRRGETQEVEFKATFRVDARNGQEIPQMARMSARAIASFLNTRGGTLLIGVADDRTVSGVDADIRALSSQDRDGVDVFQQTIANELRDRLTAAVSGQLDIQLVNLDGRWVCIVRAPRSARPVFMSSGKDQDEFWIRSGTTTQQLSIQQANEYIRSHWG